MILAQSEFLGSNPVREKVGARNDKTTIPAKISTMAQPAFPHFQTFHNLPARHSFRGRSVLLIMLCAVLLLPTSAAAQKAKEAAYKKTYVSDMEAFLQEAQANYPFWDLKGLRKGWKAKKKDLEKRAKKCKTDVDFIRLVYEGMGYLRDAHMYMTECKIEMPRGEPSFYSGISFLPATDGRVIVMHPPEGQGASLKSGTVILTINGKDARKFLDKRGEEIWEKGGGFSSPQRAALFEYRTALSAERGEKFEIVALVDKRKKKVKLSARTEISGWPRSYNMPVDLKMVGKSFYYCQLESGYGYMYLRRVDSSIAEGMKEALAELADVPGWVIDLRGNSGGGYNDDLVNQVKAVQKPTVVIGDAGCISAGETLIRDFIRYADARFIGTPTAGSSSSKKEWQFPSGIATVKFSTRSRYGPDGEPIEFNGIKPHEIVEAVPEEVLDGKNSEILRAVEYLQTQD